MVGDQVCVGIPGRPYISPAPTTLVPSIPTTAAAVPTNVAGGTNNQCGRYYEAIQGDYCNLVIMRFSISLDDFLFLNTAINENCTNLFAFESYCVQAVGDSEFSAFVQLMARRGKAHVLTGYITNAQSTRTAADQDM